MKTVKHLSTQPSGSSGINHLLYTFKMVALLLTMNNCLLVTTGSATPLTAMAKIDTRLFNTSNLLIDANVVVFDAAYSNAVDIDDAPKMSNPGENIAIQRGASVLVVEGRQPAVVNDLVPFRMWNMHQQNYRLDFIAANMTIPGLTAFLEDGYLNTSIALNPNGTTSISFTVDGNPGSAAANRFRIVFKQSAVVLPVSFISISAARSTAGVKLDWKVSAQRNIIRYEVQRSTDGRRFFTAGTVTAAASNSIDLSYHFTDVTAAQGTVFYRINSIGIAGDDQYSPVVKVNTADGMTGIAIVSNPVENGVVNLQFKNKSVGRYGIRIINDAGQSLLTNTINLVADASNELISLPAAMPGGVYRLLVTAPDHSQEVRTFVVNKR